MDFYYAFGLEELPKFWKEVINTFLIILIFVVVPKIILWLIKKSHSFLSMKNINLGETLLKSIRRPLNIIFVLLGIYIALRRLGIVSQVLKIIDSIAYVLIIVSSAYLVSSILNAFIKWYSENVASKTETKFDDEFLPLINRVLKIAIYVVAIMMILSYFGQNITALLTALGVGSLAIALASQEAIANMFAGFIIMIDRPYKLGDRIKLPTGEIGDVEYIGLRNTRLKLVGTSEETILIVSNTELMRSRIQNFGKKS